ncbi:MAG: DsrE/DsrF/TusD sulfur relay family protein [Myxococcota bacterium]
MARTLFILNDPPYGTELAYNGLRLAGSLAKREDEEVRLFLMGDAASCAKDGQKTPNGYYNIRRMLRAVTRRGGEVGVCGTCMDARGITDEELAEDTRRGTLDELTDWTQWAEKVLVF